MPIRSAALVRRRCRSAAVLAYALAASLAAVASAGAAGGDLDVSFGSGGIVTEVVGGSARGIALQPDGRIVLAGNVGMDFAVARFLPNGTLDPSFGTGGVAVTDVGGTDAADAVAVQPDGKLVVAGFSALPAWRFAVARYDADGVLDASFGAGGTTTIPFGGSAQAWKVLVQADGKLVVVGGVGGNSFGVARLLPDGTLDASFGSGGTTTTSFGDGVQANGALLQPDGAIVVSGGGSAGFALVRYLADGSRDPTFGASGVATTSLGAPAAATGIALLADGRIVAGGFSYASGGVMALARYLPSGALDPTFGSGGIAASPFAVPAYGSGVALAADGSILVSGSAVVGGRSMFALARYGADGAPDAGFGSGGLVTTDFGSGLSSNATALVVQPDGRVVLGGLAWTADWQQTIALARYQLGGGAADEITALRARVTGVGPGTSLGDKLDRALNALAAADTATACSVLRAFDHEVSAQSGKRLPAPAAEELLAASGSIEGLLDCS